MSLHPLPQLAKSDLDRLRRFRVLPNLKIPLFAGAMVAFTMLAWHTDSWLVRWSAYIVVGYLWMSMVTFMHDATHFTLFRTRMLNWVYGILCLLPIFATFVAFRQDHIEHHRHNRSARDPDAFTMGSRRVVDFVVFYAYVLAGGVLTFLHFNFIYPFTNFGPRQWAIQIFEIALKGAVYWLVLDFAAEHGVLGKALKVWLWPVFFLSLMNSMRFLSEHYGTHWGEGPLRGTRTVISNGSIRSSGTTSTCTSGITCIRACPGTTCRNCTGSWSRRSWQAAPSWTAAISPSTGRRCGTDRSRCHGWPSAWPNARRAGRAPPLSR